MAKPPGSAPPSARYSATAVALFIALAALLIVTVKFDALSLADPRLWASLLALLVIAAVIASTMLWRQRERTLLLELQAQSDRFLRQFYDLPFIGIALSSPASKRWLQCNDRLCEILGYSRAEMTRMSWAQMTHPDDLSADLRQFEQVISGESDG